ncbi:hypothetical protein [Paenibacillus sp. Marseille-Q4541]|uniref:hypothetical protein n=1 Tax=Paenibacillus sp. Marseille-Q4541 TaxID=2831522 RepID=UPI001BA82B33|nr:hypothetical protein [Paenibacillus sp. Marseille-Q4541]
MEVDYARAKLRKGKDEDLKQAFSKIPNHYDQSYIVREALRQFFFTREGRTPLFYAEQLYETQTSIMPQHKAHVRDVELEIKPSHIKLEKVEEDIDLDKAIDSLLD